MSTPSDEELIKMDGITIIYFIAIGLQMFILLFLLAKRQIMRYSWGPKKAPFTPIGTGFPKEFKSPVVSYLNTVGSMKWEPADIASRSEIFFG